MNGAQFATETYRVETSKKSNREISFFLSFFLSWLRLLEEIRFFLESLRLKPFCDNFGFFFFRKYNLIVRNPPPRILTVGIPRTWDGWVVSNPRTPENPRSILGVVLQGGSSSSECLIWDPFKEFPPGGGG